MKGDNTVGTSVTPKTMTFDNVVIDLDSQLGGLKLPLFTCTTAASAAAKAATSTIDEWYLVSGTMILVKFTNTNTATNPTLSINGSTAKYIKRYGTTAVGTNTTNS